MGPVLAIALKDLKLLVRDKAGFFFTFIFPLLYGIFFGVVFSGGGGGGGGVPIAIVDLDGSPSSIRLSEEISANTTVRVLEGVADEASGRELVRKGDARAVVVLPEGFGASIDTPLIGGPIAIGGAIDPSSSMAGGILQGALMQSLFTVLAERVTDPETARSMVDNASSSLLESNASPQMKLLMGGVFTSVRTLLDAPDANPVETADAQQPESDAGGDLLNGLFSIDFEQLTPEGRDGPANAFEITIPQANAWALMGCIFGFATGLVMERSRGTMPRLLSGPITRSTLLLGKGLGCFITAVAVQWFLLVIGMVFMGVQIASVPVALVATVSSAFAFVGVTMLLASLGRTEAGAEGMGRAVMLILAFIGGAAVPIDFLGVDWLQKLAVISPFRWSILAMEGAIWRQYSLAELALPAGVLLGIGVLGTALGARMFEFSHAEGDR